MQQISNDTTVMHQKASEWERERRRRDKDGTLVAKT